MDIAGRERPLRRRTLHALLQEPRPVEMAAVMSHVWPDAQDEPDYPWDCLQRAFRLLNETLARSGYVIARYLPRPVRYRIERRTA